MFTRNFYYALSNAVAPQYTPAISAIPSFKTISGSSISTASSLVTLIQLGASSTSKQTPNMANMATNLTSYGGVIIGTGTTPPTIDDYKLSGDMITTFTYSQTVTADYSDDGLILTGLYTITNTGSTDFTIGEIGLVADYHYSSGTTDKYKCLLERTVLDEPVTIPAGGIGQVTYTITMDYPTE